MYTIIIISEAAQSDHLQINPYFSNYPQRGAADSHNQQREQHLVERAEGETDCRTLKRRTSTEYMMPFSTPDSMVVRHATIHTAHSR
jgi:hypothetical protein